MQCKAFCSANSYQMIPLYKFLRKNPDQVEKFSNAIYAPLYGGHIFFFSYGCIVFWGIETGNIKQVLKNLKEFEIEPLSKEYSDSYPILKGNVTKVYHSDISLKEDDGILERLSISYALAQSIKLSVFEERVEDTIKKTEHIPKSLAMTGKINLSGKEIAQKMGKLFIERSSINLSTNIIGTPDFFWDHPELESIYQMTAYDQELKDRAENLNKRFKLIHELFEIVSDVFNNRHSSLLEIIIIILITLEIIITIAFHMV